jgi:hypothetical protein
MSAASQQKMTYLRAAANAFAQFIANALAGTARFVICVLNFNLLFLFIL